MAEQKSEGGGSLLANPSALFALLTVAAGLWLVSRQLTSDRPVTPAGGSAEFVGDQKLEARLWEDPFKSAGNGGPGGSPAGGGAVTIDLETLIGQVQRRGGSDNLPRQIKPAIADRGTLLLPVMLSGGQYSEDQESRVRSRFAIVSALGRAGYAPEDAEHLGVMQIPWLTENEVNRAKQTPPDDSAKITHLWAVDRSAPENPVTKLLGVVAPPTHPAQMQVHFEWYSPRVFAAGANRERAYSHILVLWLDDSYFEDEPLLRLALLLEPLTDLDWLKKKVSRPEVALIGPRRSSTLRNMLPDWQTAVLPLAKIPNQALWTLGRKVLQQVDVYCATPSAMDEVLVKDVIDPDRTPREAVKESLRRLTEEGGFKDFHNFAATDAQMAHEIFAELKLRGADLTNEKNHVVLISEWDTFYARILELTYGAELTVDQVAVRPVNPRRITRAQFVDAYTALNKSPAQAEAVGVMPKNFHSFVYLRGLDGQTVGGEGGARASGADPDRSGKTPPTSIEELRHWSPDVNKAEGQAQFDYLGRLGERLEELQKHLQRRDGSEIRAIGIVGSDVYDTLLILQALRQRFPGVLFFTTDLDVRFLHPREREWARNLIVASSYGLALHRDLQGSVAPFRDSTQTAQFAAVLAALGNGQLAGVVKIPARRFEIGNRVAVDLSKESGELVTAPPQPAADKPLWLHPKTASEKHREYSTRDYIRLGCGFAAAVLLLAGLSWAWDPLRRFTWEAFKYPAEALEYSEEDIGGPDGAAALLEWLKHNREDRLAKRLLPDGEINAIRQRLEVKPENEPAAVAGERAVVLASATGEELKKQPTGKPDDKREAAGKPAAIDWGREKILAELTDAFVKTLNQLLREKNPLAEAPRPGAGPPGSAKPHWFPIRHLRELSITRGQLDAVLNRVAGPRLSAPDRPLGLDAGLLAWLAGELRRCLPNLRLGEALDWLRGSRKRLLHTLERGAEDFEESALQAAIDARTSAARIFDLRCLQLRGFWIAVPGFALVALWLVWAIWHDTFQNAEGEPFSLTSGISAWPAQVLRLVVFGLAVCFGFGLPHRMREAYYTLTREFRLSLSLVETDGSVNQVCARTIWQEYGEVSHFRRRMLRIGGAVFGYVILTSMIYVASGEFMFNPVRGDMVWICNLVLLLGSTFGFLFLAFLTVDAACLCRGFIQKLSARPTLYPKATRRHFSRLMGRLDDEYLDEWIDLQLIAELTERVGRLVYYPAVLVLLLFLARNSWWDCWPWPVSLIIVFAFNFLLALASVVILQCAAKDAKRQAEQSLTARVKKLQAQAAPSAAQNNADQAEKLLEEIRQLRRGAFVPFWENPVVGAVFLSSGGTTALQVLIWFMGR